MRTLFFRVSIHPMTLALWALVVLVMAVVTGEQHLEALMSHLGSDALEGQLTLEEDVAIMLVAFGVFLETREMLAARVYGNDMPEREHALNQTSESFGAFLLIIGLLMETSDQSFEPLLLEAGLAQLGIGLMVLFDAATVLLSGAYVFALFKGGNRSPASNTH